MKSNKKKPVETRKRERWWEMQGSRIPKPIPVPEPAENTHSKNVEPRKQKPWWDIRGTRIPQPVPLPEPPQKAQKPKEG